MINTFSAVMSFIMAASSLIGLGGEWEPAYTSAPASCTVAAKEITNLGGPAFKCDGGTWNVVGAEAEKLQVSLASGTSAELQVSYDKSTKTFQGMFTKTEGTGFEFAGAGIVPVCIDSGHVIKRGTSVNFTTSGTINAGALNWDRCYQNQTAGVEVFTSIADNSTSLADPGIQFHGTPYRYFTVVGSNGKTSYGVSWLDWMGEWTVEYDDAQTYTVSSAFRASALRFDDWPSWWKENILEYCSWGLSGANPTILSYGRGNVLAPLTSDWTAVFDHPCYKSRLDAFGAKYLPDYPIDSYKGWPTLTFSNHVGSPDFSSDTTRSLFSMSWGGPTWDQLPKPNMDTLIENGTCTYDSDNNNSDFLAGCTFANNITPFTNFGSRMFIKYPNFAGDDNQYTPYTDCIRVTTYNTPSALPNKCQLGYANLGTTGGIVIPSKMQVGVFVPSKDSGVDVSNPEGPLVGFDPDPTNTNPTTQTYIFYDTITGETINTGVCVYSTCVWNTWITNTPVFQPPATTFECEKTIICLGNFYGWWNSAMNFITQTVAWTVALVYPSAEQSFDPTLMLRAAIDSNPVVSSARSLWDGVKLAFVPYFGPDVL